MAGLRGRGVVRPRRPQRSDEVPRWPLDGPTAASRRPRAGEPGCVPKAHAFDFARFCPPEPAALPAARDRATPTDLSPTIARRGPRARPAALPRLARGIVADVNDASHVWAGDELTGFLLGCSFVSRRSRRGHPPRHAEAGTNVAMYVTNVENAASGPFGGRLVVRAAHAPGRAGRRGADGGVPRGARGPGPPGRPAALGGSVRADSATRFRCSASARLLGLRRTPQSALADAALPLCVTRTPGHMFVCDLVEGHALCDAQERDAPGPSYDARLLYRLRADPTVAARARRRAPAVELDRSPRRSAANRGRRCRHRRRRAAAAKETAAMRRIRRAACRTSKSQPRDKGLPPCRRSARQRSACAARRALAPAHQLRANQWLSEPHEMTV